MREPVAIDLFCGVGGITHGFVRSGVKVVAGIDIDQSCEYAYETNNGAEFICRPIEEVTGEDLRRYYPEDSIKILIGCAPCQPFSMYNSRKRKDGKWGLLHHFGRLVEELKPEIVSMENVPQIMKHEVFADFLTILEKENYNVSYSIVYCPNYGIPQSRRRLVLMASKLGDIELLAPTHTRESYVTVRQAIGCLEPIRAGECSPSDSLHVASRLTDINLRRIRATPEGGGWSDWPEELLAECHRRDSGKSYGAVYGRMRWDDVGPTITTLCNGYGNGRFGHPEQERALSLREAAILQTFPQDYEFVNPANKFYLKDVARQIGNAVPVRLGEVVAESIMCHLGVYSREH